MHLIKENVPTEISTYHLKAHRISNNMVLNYLHRGKKMVIRNLILLGRGVVLTSILPFDLAHSNTPIVCMLVTIN